MSYSEAFRSKVVRKLTGPSAISAHALAKEIGVSHTTLSRWVRQAGSLSGMSDEKKMKKERSPNQWSSMEKLRAVVEAASLDDDQLGEFLRREGIHKTQLDEWRAGAVSALEGPRKLSKTSAEARKVRELEKELRRKERALAETAALLVLKKKAQEIWGDEDDSTDGKTEN